MTTTNKHIFTVLSGIILLIGLGCSDLNSHKSNSSKFINKQKCMLLGKWTMKDYRPYHSTELEFFDNNIWRETYIKKGDTSIYKGKYVIGPENEVFLRCFGLRHWNFVGDTIIDSKTSIGAEVLFLYDTVLVNNQEDYKDEYFK